MSTGFGSTLLLTSNLWGSSLFNSFESLSEFSSTISKFTCQGDF